ncbi:adenosylmethionine decarboxylase [Conchiformibius kuhniae]|uniref:Adenosylmethionine decarboxylase n=1 Tax=Conchiformibius kuhniae TaxID=211502 RepID=A0ABD8B8L3_9NEIS|nr:adenosylmethionine decarboxylase [Conchiformibius kuhniae]
MNRHGLLDAYGCPPDLLRDASALQTVLQTAAQAAGATVLWAHFHTFGGAGGVTGVLLLAESHISIHTWPEHGFAAADVFVCGQLRLHAARRILEQSLRPQHSEWTEHGRGAFAPSRGVPSVEKFN